MKELTDKSFSDALFDCYITPNSEILIVFGRYNEMFDFSHYLREIDIQGAEVSMVQNFDHFRDKLNIRFKNGSAIRAIHLSALLADGASYDEMLVSSDICNDDEALAYVARHERPRSPVIRKMLSHRPVATYKEVPTEPDTEALDAFLSEFSIVKS